MISCIIQYMPPQKFFISKHQKFFISRPHNVVLDWTMHWGLGSKDLRRINISAHCAKPYICPSLSPFIYHTIYIHVSIPYTFVEWLWHNFGNCSISTTLNENILGPSHKMFSFLSPDISAHCTQPHIAYDAVSAQVVKTVPNFDEHESGLMVSETV